MFNRNLNLNELKKIFDRIESYNTNQNIGLRSLKNIGVWLCIYALTDESDQAKVIQELGQKADLKENLNLMLIKKLADDLIQPQVLASIITDYEKANGAFTLTVNSEFNHGQLISKIKEKNYEDILIKHVQIDLDQDADLTFLMKNEIKFNWAANRYDIEAGKFKQTKAKFRGETIDFLEANDEDHRVEYGIIEHNNRLHHVARLGTLQKDGDKEFKRTNTYLIESVDPNDAIYLQKDYFEIIDRIKDTKFNDQTTFNILKNNKFAAQNTQVSGKLSNKYNQFNYTVLFPQILDTLLTTEKRLGIYEHFVKKTIANLPIDKILYLGKRELTYDDKGGEIKNREEVMCLTESCSVGPNTINIIYTAANPFMMIYEAENGADYYPYFIADPKKNLAMTFEKNQAYPDQQKLVGPASTGNSIFSQVFSGVNNVANTAGKVAENLFRNVI
jgi:hypothetical protein